MELTYCTLTGVDSRTDLDAIATLSAEYPIVEWGLLYSPKRQGLPGRYPSVVMLQRLLLELPADIRLALHVCGSGVPDLLADADAVVCELADMVEARGGRIQLNFNHSSGDVAIDALERFLQRRPHLRVITQRNAANAGVWEALSDCENHSILFDASGGRGVSPDVWPAPLHPARCGYAGGLSPENLLTQLQGIEAVAGNATTWIDMEGSLRLRDEIGDDWFNLARARAVLHQLARWKAD